MGFLAWLKERLTPDRRPEHLRTGSRGETAARRHLQSLGLKFLMANFRSKHGEIDLLFRDEDCLVFVEVKTRASDSWTRPSAAVNTRKRHALSRTAIDYLRQLKDPRVKFRFDIVEVLLTQDEILEIRHLPNAFTLSRRYVVG